MTIFALQTGIRGRGMNASVIFLMQDVVGYISTMLPKYSLQSEFL